MLRHVDLNSPEMSGAELGRSDIEAMIAERATGAGLDLAGKRLNRLDLAGLDLHGADLTRAKLDGKLEGADLRGATLDLAWAMASTSQRRISAMRPCLAQLIAPCSTAPTSRAPGWWPTSTARAVRVDLKGARMQADMKNQSMGLMRTVLRSAILDQATLAGANLERADLEFAKLKGADLAGANLTMAKLGGADLTGANVTDADFTGADLASAILRQLTGLDRAKGLDKAQNLDRAFKD